MRAGFRWILGAGLLALLNMLGCGNAPSSEPTGVGERPGSAGRIPGAGPERGTQREWGDPRETLRSVFDRYRGSRTYRDSAQLVASTRDARGEEISNAVAPLGVWFADDRVYVEAYQARVWSDGQRLTAWFRSPETDDFDSQVLSRPAPSGRPDAELLLSDPVVAAAMLGGAGGPPPQLDWLFSAEPMSGLFESQPEIRWGSPATVDQQVCETIIVTDAGERFVFYLDRPRSLIRRIDLPSALPSETSAIATDGSSASDAATIELTLFLTGATFSEVNGVPGFEPMPKSPRWVDHFVALPPDPPFGSVPSSLSLDSKGWESGTVGWVSNTRSDATLRWMQELRQRWRQAHPGSIEILLDSSAGQRWGIKGRVRSSQTAKMEAESVWLVDGDGRIHFSQRLIPPVVPDTLMGATTDLSKGINVRRRLRDQWERARAAYLRELRSAATDQG